MTSHQDATATARAKEVLAQCLEHVMAMRRTVAWKLVLRATA